MNTDVIYSTGAFSKNGWLTVAGASKELEQKNIEHSLIALWNGSKWIASGQIEINVVSVCQGKGDYSEQTVFAGINGEILIGTPSGFRKEILGVGKNAPSRLRNVHQIRAIGEHFIVVGMRRQVFRKHMRDSSWEKIDNGVFVTDTSTEIAGFTSVDGFSEKEIYAVGHRGEIWMFDGQKWTQIESPTNLILECVRCLPSGDVMACGDAGVILRGRGGSWTELKQDITEETVVSLAGLGDTVFFATAEGTVLALHQDEFNVVEIKKGKSVTTGVLDSNGKAILSVGASDIYLFDRKKWQRIPDPQFKLG